LVAWLVYLLVASLVGLLAHLWENWWGKTSALEWDSASVVVVVVGLSDPGLRLVLTLHRTVATRQ
jgi:hypothetical protein